MKTLLITGASGFLGGCLARRASSCWKTYAAYHTAPIDDERADATLRLDVTDREEVKRAIHEAAPDVVVHAAAVTDSNYCAENREEAWAINVKGTENMAVAAEEIGARLIYLSTDLVFDGEGRFYTEEDAPRPVCYYGKTKLEGEKAVSSSCSDYRIVRTALIYGSSSNSSRCFTEIMMENLKKGKDLTLFTDEYRTPVYIGSVCDILLELAERETPAGVFHAAGPERMSRFDFGVKLVEVFGFGKERLIPVSVNDFPFKDKRPKDCSMRSDKIRGALKTKIWGLERGLTEMKQAGAIDEPA